MNAYTYIKQLVDFHDAGSAVTRMHTMRVLQRQNIAEHSWGVAMILRYLYAPALPSSAVLCAALLHDVPESYTGDAPANVKWNNPVVTAEYDRMERTYWADHEADVPTECLTEDERTLLKLADSADLLMYALREIHMGNTALSIVALRVQLNINKRFYDNSFLLGHKHAQDLRRHLTRSLRDLGLSTI